MRLIDADVMVDIIRKSNESHATNSREEVLLERNARLIEEQAKYHPVNIEPRPHGEWKPHDQHGLTKVWYERYKCSNCNEYGWLYWHFCPNCGADMREGDSN